MPQPATMSTSQSSPMKKSLYTVSVRPVWVITTGMCTDSCLVPGAMWMSMPDLSVLVSMTIWAVLARPSSFPSLRILYAPTGSPSRSAISLRSLASILSMPYASFI